jgi:hypothetical protein
LFDHNNMERKFQITQLVSARCGSPAAPWTMSCVRPQSLLEPLQFDWASDRGGDNYKAFTGPVIAGDGSDG